MRNNITLVGNLVAMYSKYKSERDSIVPLYSDGVHEILGTSLHLHLSVDGQIRPSGITG